MDAGPVLAPCSSPGRDLMIRKPAGNFADTVSWESAGSLSRGGFPIRRRTEIAMPTVVYGAADLRCGARRHAWKWSRIAHARRDV